MNSHEIPHSTSAASADSFFSAPTAITAELVEAAKDIRLVVSDMDGTLLDEAGQLPESFWPMAQKLRERGVLFCPASGRQYAMLAGMFAPILEGLPVIAENGSLALIGEEVVHTLTFKADVAREAIRMVRHEARGRVAMIVCTQNGAYTDCSDPFFLGEARKYYAHLDFVEDIEDLDFDVLKLAVFDFEEAEKNILPLFETYRDQQYVAVAAPLWMDMMSKGVNKGIALRSVQKHLGITPEQTLVFGDFLNDLEMMEEGKFSFAMSNAHPGIIEAAAYVAPSNNNRGVIRVIEDLILSPPTSSLS